jgi:hypothetical protein
LAHTLVCLLPTGRIRSIGLGLTLIYAAAAPWLLMHASFSRGFAGYCLVATVSGVVTFACGALIRPHDRLPLRDALISGGGLLAGTVLIVIATSLQGMSIGSLIWGVILNPLHHPNVFSIPWIINWRDSLAAVILTTCVVGLGLRGRVGVESRWLDVLRCAAGIASILLLTVVHRIGWVVPLLPLTLIPGSHWERSAGALFSRLFITCMAVTQFLEPFPVAGSQVGIAAAPMILWAFLCISDGIAGLRTSSSRTSQDFGEGLRLDAVIGGAFLVLFAGASIALSARLVPRSAWVSRFPPASTGLRGSEWLHLPPEQANTFESIARNVGTNCSALFSMPGMGSFNIWSGVPTPNGWNVSAWMRVIGPERQAEILNIMKANSQTCAILNRSIMGTWANDEAGVAALPLARYVMTDMPKIAEFGEYEIRVHPHRSSAWLQSP